jgi:hypothetical protein
MRITHLTRADYRRMRWRNGSGWTTELARHPDGADDAAFNWRVSLADVEQDGEFSAWPDYERSIVLLEGNGMELLFGSDMPVLLRQRGQVQTFGGEAAVRCRLVDGPTRDFNVFTRRAACSHRVMFRPLVGPMVLFPERGVLWLVHVVAGAAHQQHATRGVSAVAGETLVLEHEHGSRQTVLAGGGELLLVRIEDAAG